MPLGGFR